MALQPGPSETVPTRFIWPYGGRQVHVCGSFTNWLTPIPMAPDGTAGGRMFAVVCNLPPGCVALRSGAHGLLTRAPPRSYHQYKFIVDGKWQHDEGQAFVTDPLGNTNNWHGALTRPRPPLPHPITAQAVREAA